MPFIVFSFFLFLALSPQALAHKDAHDGELHDEIQIQKLSKHISMIQAGGGNIAVLHGKDGVLVIDNGLEDKRKIVSKALKQVTDKPINFLVNTHWHFDHAGNNEVFGEEGTTILAHENVRRRLQSGGEVKAFDAKIAPYPKAALPVITYQDQIKLHLNDQNVEIYTVNPAHTDGDSFIVFPEEDIIHTGDLFFNGFWPFIDASSGGSIEGVVTAVNQILSIAGDATKIIPGHGYVGTRDDLVAYRDVLKAVIVKIKQARDNKKTRAEWISSNPLQEYDSEWGRGFLSTEKFTAIAWDVSQ